MTTAPKDLHSTFLFKWPLILFVLSVFVAILFYLALIINFSVKREQSAQIYQQSLVATINQFEYLPALLSTEALFLDTLLDANKSRYEANRKLNFIAKRAGAEAVYIMDIHGTVIATSNYNSERSFLNKNYSFRPYFKDAITERTRQFYYAKGATTGIPGFFISDPMIHAGQPIGVAVVKLKMEYWEENWRNSQDDLIVADENKVIILSTKEEWRYQSIGKLSSSTIDRIKQQQQFTGKEHQSIYRQTFDLGLIKPLNMNFWVVNNNVYLAHKFTIPEVNWSLYYLVQNKNFFYPSLFFLLMVYVLLLSFYFIRRERHHKLESINKTRRLELNRGEELKTVMDNIHIGVALFTKEGCITSINDHAKFLLFDGQLPSPDHTVYIDKMINIDINNLDNILVNDVSSQPYQEAYTIKNAQHNIPVIFAIGKVSIMEESLYLMTFINIQRRKAAEDELLRINNSLEDMVSKRTLELEKAQKRLLQKNKAAALGNMAATIVHELSQPLSAMNSSIGAIKAKINNEDWPGVIQSANRLSPLSEKMHKVIKLLKYFSYQDMNSDTPISLTEIVEKSLDTFTDVFAEKNITFTYKKDPEIDNIYIKINALKLDLALSNIIKNAIDASEKNKHPKIDTHIFINEKKNAQINISDNGGGVDSAIMNKLFSPYFTTKEVGKGLGLGLSITYEIIQEYHGKITVNNIKDGAEFSILLPLDYSENRHENSIPANETH